MSKKNSNLWELDSHTTSLENHSKKAERPTEEEILKIKEKSCIIELYGGMTFDEAIWELLERKEKWENCYIDFNWKKLYSVDINNENDAYLQFFWKTKAQVEMDREKYRQEYEARKQREKLEAIEKIPGWVDEGKKYIDESKWQDWESYVNSSARDMYHWMDIDSTLELLKLIENWESWENVQKAFDNQWHSGFSYSVVRNRVVYFSKKWNEADKMLKGNW